MTTIVCKCITRKCKWYMRPVGDGGIHVCKAFPQGIPNEIANGDNPHTKPYPGDGGITFEKVQDASSKR
jgi:hypothetical protein